MLKKLFLLSIMVFTLTIVSTKNMKAQEVTIDYFYDQLAPYGHWENVDAYGWVWKPYNVQPGWHPYSDGSWVYTEFGWTYQSDNEWGWAVYHYGRWAYLDYGGWVWVPGTEWSPAWVAWRNDNDYIGWAPLPPQVEWRGGEGLHASNFNIDVDIRWSNWCFVDINHFDHPRLSIYIENCARNVTFIRRTHDITHYNYENHRIINHCIDADRWEHTYHRPLVRYNVIDAPSYRKVGINRTPDRREIHVYRPQFQSRQERTAPPRQTENRRDLSSSRRYDKERSKYDKHYDREYQNLIENQRREEAVQNHNREEVQNQHKAEIDAYREQRNRETRQLETRHVDDMDRAVRQKPVNDNKNSSKTENKDRKEKEKQKDQQPQKDQSTRRR